MAQMAEWGRKRDALGFAYLDDSGSQVAGIAEVSLDLGNGQIKVHNFPATIGRVAAQPDNVVAQTESSIVYGLSSRAHHHQEWCGRQNFYDYRVPRMKDVPQMHIEVSRPSTSDGPGAATPLVAPAISEPATRAPRYLVHSGAGQESIGVRNEQLGRKLNAMD